MKFSVLHMSGKNYPTFDPPFYMGADLKWYYTHNNKRFGPFDDKPSAVSAYQTEVHLLEGAA